MKRTFIKDILVNHKKRYLVTGLILVWVGIFTYIFMDRSLRKPVQITDAFMDSQSSNITSTLEIAGALGTKELSEQEKEAMIQTIADGIGLNLTDGMGMVKHDAITEVYAKRAAKAADTSIKLVSVDTMEDGKVAKTNHYMLVKLEIYDCINSILEYKQLIENAYEDLGIGEAQTTVALTGTYPGVLTLAEKNKVADRMIAQLGANVTYANRTNDMYTVYAYSGNLKDYIQVADSKVNIQVAMNYDEQTDQTVVYLATPLLNGSYYTE